jgi:hypothetical protein
VHYTQGSSYYTYRSADIGIFSNALGYVLLHFELSVPCRWVLMRTMRSSSQATCAMEVSHVDTAFAFLKIFG